MLLQLSWGQSWVELMKKIGGLIEGLIVFALGLAMCGLVMADNYWMYLHPKFKWLTLSAGVVLMVVGAIAALYNRRPSLIRISIFFVFLYMIQSNHLHYRDSA